MQAVTDVLSMLSTCNTPQLLYLLESLQAINHDKSDLDAKWDKAVLHDTIGEPRKASNFSGTGWILLSAAACFVQTICSVPTWKWVSACTTCIRELGTGSGVQLQLCL